MLEKEILTTKEDLDNVKTGLMRYIYVVGLIQFLGITASISAIIDFSIK